jgi:precorrin-6B methylase 1
VTFTITVRPQFSGTPTGTVTLARGTVTLATLSLTSGQASYTAFALPAGTSNLKVLYGGDSNFTGSTSSVLKHVIKKAATTTTLVSSQNPSAAGQRVTFTDCGFHDERDTDRNGDISIKRQSVEGGFERRGSKRQ